MYDVQGRTVAEIEVGWQPPGSHVIDVDASSLPSGVYLYSLVSGGVRQTCRMVVIR